MPIIRPGEIRVKERPRWLQAYHEAVADGLADTDNQGMSIRVCTFKLEPDDWLDSPDLVDGEQLYLFYKKRIYGV